MRGGTVVVLLYTAFAIVATAGNLATQRLALSLVEGGWAFPFALIVGTFVGLVIKYGLDKRLIFEDRSTGLAAHGRRFSLYTLMGIATTAIFWGTETLFWFFWNSHSAREIGAVLGLSVGYFIKYRLDRRYVFHGGAMAARPA